MTIALRASDLLELAIILFQVVGVLSLGACRLIPRRSYVQLGRIGFILALVGLGLAGAFCGRQDSEFALFAGGTMTVLLIGMTIGGGASTPPLHGAEAVTPEKGYVG